MEWCCTHYLILSFSIFCFFPFLHNPTVHTKPLLYHTLPGRKLSEEKFFTQCLTDCPLY